jgi:hypothetical protein
MTPAYEKVLKVLAEAYQKQHIIIVNENGEDCCIVSGALLIGIVPVRCRLECACVCRMEPKEEKV